MMEVKKMIDLKMFADEILSDYEYLGNEGKQKMISFLEDNDWFGCKPVLVKGQVMLTEAQVELYKDPLINFFAELSPKINSKKMHAMLQAKFPETADQVTIFFNSIGVFEEALFYISDFLLYSLKKDIFLMNDHEVSELMDLATRDMIKSHGLILTFFLSWLKGKYKTAYKKEYFMKNRYSMANSKQAYEFDEYLKLLYYLFNEDYIRREKMYKKATESKNYADTWLFLSLHFICSLRTTDMERIPHPTLLKSPISVLKQIKKDQYADSEARQVLLSITSRLCLLPLTPNKTNTHKNISQIKFNVPESCEVHIGTLLSICEAHSCLAGDSKNPLIRKISDYDRISRYMGEEIGSLFLESNFRSRSANKSYLQSLCMVADGISGEEDGAKIKGYMLAAIARSHKGSWGKFAGVTATYLKDAKMNGLSAEFVAKELFERGVLSFVPSMLLKIITEGSYNDLSFSQQTLIIQKLNLSPNEIEQTMEMVSRSKQQAEEIVKELLTSGRNNIDILGILHKIGTGEAFSKQPESLCLLTAVNQVCSFDNRTQCVGCKYEIKTKSTMLLLVSEYKRVLSLYQNSSEEIEKEKYRQLLTTIILPCLDEILVCLKDQYGPSVFRSFERLIKEYTQ